MTFGIEIFITEIIGIIAFAVVRFMCKGEPYLVNFVVENLGQSEVYHG